MTHEAQVGTEEHVTVARCTVTDQLGVGPTPEEAMKRLDSNCPEALHIAPTWVTWRPGDVSEDPPCAYCTHDKHVGRCPVVEEEIGEVCGCRKYRSEPLPPETLGYLERLLATRVDRLNRVRAIPGAPEVVIKMLEEAVAKTRVRIREHGTRGRA